MLLVLYNFCAGQTYGVEDAIHSMRTIFNDDNSEGFLVMQVMLLTHRTGQ